VTAIKSFFIAMLRYPNIQKKAQDELDSVIGRERLPTFEDRPRLPFIDAVCKEILRWNPVTPLGAFDGCSCEVSEWYLMYDVLTGSSSTCGHRR
jgi:cytochrome P450